MIRARRFNSHLSFESLESRWTMTGDVAAFAGPDLSGENTVLVIEGDNLANEIRVIEDEPGHAIIQGLNGTTISGKAFDEVFSSAIEFSGAEVRLGNGDDRLLYEFGGSQGQHFTRIDSGNGNDEVTVFVQGPVGFLGIETGVGNDEFTVNLAPSSFLTSSFSLNTGVGNDSVFIRANSVGGIPILSSLSLIETEQGDDVVQFDGLFGVLGGDLIVLLGEGDDTLVGDPEDTLTPVTVESLGGSGVDTVINASYFGLFGLYQFETIVG